MKNKVFSRVFALVGVAVLMFALAVPCFADAPAPVRQDIVAYTFTDVASFSEFIYTLDDYTSLDRVTFYVESFGEGILNDVGISFDDSMFFVASNVNVYNANIDGVTGTIITWLYFTEETPDEFTLIQGMINFVDGSSSVSNDISYVITDDDTFSITVYCLRDSGSTAPTKSGLFGQLYNILADAIYGDGAVLDGTQDFALTLVVTLLVLATVLLPVLLVFCFLLRFLRW
jgi:hypothetical protein